jgi:soluble cytochrome b562
MAEFTAEDAFNIILNSLMEGSNRERDLRGQMEMHRESKETVMRSLTDTREALARVTADRDKTKALAKEGEKLWKNADLFLKEGSMDDIGNRIIAFRAAVAAAGDAGLDPDAIPF